jgi:hypothetical protein
MKKIIFSTLFLLIVIAAQSQNNKADLLQNLEKNQSADQNAAPTATLTSASRLFSAKDDLTTVIEVLPKGTVVDVIDSDSTYYHVAIEDTEGYVFKSQAVLDNAPVKQAQPVQAVQPKQEVQEQQPVQEQQISRFTYLENKYGTNMAARLSAGKIWKEMNSEMVRDSWGSPQKINRVVDGNLIKEEWIFRNTWLYFENNVLVEWGPIRK